MTEKHTFRWVNIWIPILLIFVFASGMQECTSLLMFKINQNSIENSACINKNKPELKCHGKCYLKKTFQQNDENPIAPNFVYHQENAFNLCLPVFYLNANFLGEYSANSKFYFQFLLCQGVGHLNFQPPERMT